jgi:acetyl-CoA carboxylase biotin carboxylase subunit
MVTSQDLIKWQLKIASSLPLDLTQRQIKHSGVAIECRINAEDPSANYAPCPGKIETFIPPGGPGVRVDTHLYQGATITTYYDSMIAKVIVHQASRAEAIATMKRALQEFLIEPIKTTIPACLAVLSHNLYVRNKIDTGFLERRL